jgi:hypothetical protein
VQIRFLGWGSGVIFEELGKLVCPRPPPELLSGYSMVHEGLRGYYLSMLMEGLRVSLVPMLEGRSVHQSVSVGKDA